MTPQEKMDNDDTGKDLLTATPFTTSTIALVCIVIYSLSNLISL
jgi:hypothetical protein